MATGDRPQVLTVIIHGTFARDEGWWRRGDDPDEPTFADRLEAGLAARGVVGSVWEPALAAGLRVEDFAWSGDNNHRARVVAGLELAVTLDRAARRLGATAEAPLDVNIIAHSHGGNVALEALRRPSPRVRIRRLLFLGTPLIDRRRALRVLRAGLAVFVLGFMITAFFVSVLGFAGMIGGFEGFDTLVNLSLGAIVAMTFFGSWIFVLLAGVADLLWQAISWPIDQVRRRRRQLYGPPSPAVANLLRGRRALLVTSHFDEADLLLQLGSRPRRLFNRLVRRRWPWGLRALELVLLRPFIDWMAFYLIEMVLERYAIGLPWHLCFLNDYRLADLDRGSSYPGTIFERVDVTRYLEESLRRPTRADLQVVEPRARDEDTHGLLGEDRQMAELYAGLRHVGRTIAEQVRFLHSRYYASDTVLALIVRELVDEETDWATWRPPEPALSGGP